MKNNFCLDILAVAPHPDDIELFCGGLLAKMSAQGYKTGVLELTRGELSSAGNLEIRAKETEVATKILGLSLRECLNLPDGWIDPYAGSDLPTRNEDSQIVKVVSALRRLRPEILLIPYCEDRHPDHSAASALLSRAIFLSGVAKFPGAEPRFAPRQVLFYQMRYQFQPSFIVDIADVAVKKIEAINAYKSQLTRSSEVQTLLNSPLTISTIQARDQFYGAMIGTTHGEPFLMTNTIGMSDPIEYFRKNPYTEALLFPGKK